MSEEKPAQLPAVPVNHSRFHEAIEEQPEFFGVAPTDLTRSTVDPSLDPRRAPYVAYVVYPPNGRGIPNPTGTLLPGLIA